MVCREFYENQESRELAVEETHRIGRYAHWSHNYVKLFNLYVGVAMYVALCR